MLSLAGPLSGNRLGILTCSGGDAALAADLAQPAGLEIPPLSDRQRDAMAPLFSGYTTVANPMDYNTEIWGQPEAQRRCFEILMSEGIDVTLLIIDFAREGLMGLDSWDDTVDALIAAAQKTGSKAAAVATLPELLPGPVRDRLIAAGLLPLQGLPECIAAMSHAYAYGKQRAARLTAARSGALAVAPATAAPAAGRRLTEAESKALLAAAAVPVPPGRLVDRDSVCAAAEEIGYPVVLKAMSPDLVHKTEAGGVMLNLKNEAAVAGALAGMRALSAQFLVEQMKPGAVAELLIGVKQDPQFGPVLVLGSGGVLVELLSDAAVVLLPTDAPSVEAALRRLKIWSLLQGFRGRPAGDVAALIDSILAIADFVASRAGQLLELDINPVLIMPEGEGVWAADAYICLAQEPQDELK